MGNDEIKVTAAGLTKNEGTSADKAMVEPDVIIQNNHFRRVVRLEDFTEAAMAAADVSAGFEHLDEELKDWKI